MITTKKIFSKDTLLLRNTVLRPGKTTQECIFDGDEKDKNFHLGLFVDDQQIGILSVFKISHAFFKEKSQYQLRGMAISENYRNQNLGTKLIVEAERILIKEKAEIIWCNARKSAENFYKKNKYLPYGPYFEIEDVGLHLIMFKKLLNK